MKDNCIPKNIKELLSSIIYFLIISSDILFRDNENCANVKKRIKTVVSVVNKFIIIDVGVMAET